MLHVVIMAGGSGTRFWPLSRRVRPKQLLPLVEDADGGHSTLLRSTVDRLAPLAAIDRVYVVAGGHLAAPIAAALPDLPADNLIVEPSARNTLPCVALAATVLGLRDPDAVMAIFPADAHIQNVEAFITACERGAEAARLGKIATIGVRPTRPETGYGYIRYGEGDTAETPWWPVDTFVEKPDRATANTYLSEGNYLWNAGIFFVSVQKLKAELARQQPSMSEAFTHIEAGLKAGRTDDVARYFNGLTGVSIDYGIMEGATDVVVVPASFSWSDVGHWAAVDALLGSDEVGNVRLGRVCAIDTRQSVLVNQSGDGKLLAVVGVDDLVVVDTPDATLVLPRDEAQRVREVVAWLRERGDIERL